MSELVIIRGHSFPKIPRFIGPRLKPILKKIETAESKTSNDKEILDNTKKAKAVSWDSMRLGIQEGVVAMGGVVDNEGQSVPYRADVQRR